MNAKTYFRYLSTTTIFINLLLGLGSLFLIERVIPAIDDILSENAYSISIATEMQEIVFQSVADQKVAPELAEIFWQVVDRAENNVTVPGEKQIIDEIKIFGKRYWEGDSESLILLTENMRQLININLNSMNEKNRTAKSVGLAGAWALGFLVLASLLLQLILRKLIFSNLMEPTAQLLAVIRDYSSGNHMRRFQSNDAFEEIKDVGHLLNRLLDENMSSKI